MQKEISISLMKTKTLFLVNLIFYAIFIIGDCTGQWVQMSGGMGNNKTVRSLAISENNIFAGTGDYGVYRSTNNGQSWAQTSLNNKDINSLAINGNNVFAGTDTDIQGTEGVWLTTNNGQNWVQAGLNNYSVRSIAISGNNIFAGASDSCVYLSTNNGQTWTQTALNDKSVYSLAISGNNIFAGTYNFGIYHTTNNGQTWTQTALNDKSVYSLAISGNNIFAGTLEYGVYLSTDNGQTWTQTALNSKIIRSLAISGNNIFAGSSDTGVYLSTNNGQNWIEKNEGFNIVPGIRSLLIANNYIFAGTGNSVWRRSLTEIIGIINISTEIPSSFFVKQNNPNPFNPMTKIQFEIAQTGDVKITVYDISGKEIDMLVNERMQPGTYEVEWNGGKYASGVYFYRMQAGDYVETRKMILMK